MTAIVCGGTLCLAQEPVSPLLQVGGGTPQQDSDGATYSLPAPTADHVSVERRDGDWTLSVRVASPGAAGLQLFVEKLRLAPGAALELHAVGADGAPGPLIATYDGVGPLNGDGFWTDPVLGAEAILTVVFANRDAGSLPFELPLVRHLTGEGLEKLTVAARADNDLRHPLDGTRGLAAFRGAVVPYEVRNGLALFEGDIVLGRVEELQLATSTKGANDQRQSMGITGSYYRWPAGVVPYEIDPTLPNQVRITDAIAHWNTRLTGQITLRPRNGESEYVRFVNTTNSGSCSSYIGNNHMAAQAITIGSSCATGNVIHEIGHAVGLFHEHTREDRNTFVKINYANIDPTKTGNFDQQIASSDDLGAYDYGSIMHYPSTAFSINGLPTIETIPAGISIGQRTALSAGDIGGVQQMYTAASQTSVSVTVGSTPSGQSIIVDGVTVVAPATFQWAAGSAHTVSAPTVTNGGTRYLFKTWSDGGAQSHTITVPTSNWTVTANFQKQHSLVSSASNGTLGTVSNSPVASDTFYNEGTAVSVTAAPSASACFAGWTGISAPPATPVSVTVSQPYSVTGNFLSGALSASPTTLGVGAAAGTASISVSASSGCAWTAKSNASWITIKSGNSGTGNGVVSFSYSKKTGKAARTGTLTIGTVTVSVTQ